MRKILSVAATALIALSFTPSAQSATVAARGISSPDIVLYDDCDYHPIRYDLGVPEYTDDWSADIFIIGPDGLEEGSGYLYGDGADDDTGTEKVFMCDEPRAGRYTLRSEVEWCDYDYNCSNYVVRGSSFTVRFPRSRTNLAVRAGSRLRFTATVKDERPRGMFPSDEYTDVILQKKKGTRWVRVATGYTNERGKAHFSVKNGAGRETFRAKADFASYEDVADSTSNIITVR